MGMKIMDIGFNALGGAWGIILFLLGKSLNRDVGGVSPFDKR